MLMIRFVIEQKERFCDGGDGAEVVIVLQGIFFDRAVGAFGCFFYAGDTDTYLDRIDPSSYE